MAAPTEYNSYGAGESFLAVCSPRLRIANCELPIDYPLDITPYRLYNSVRTKQRGNYDENKRGFSRKAYEKTA